MCPLSICAVSFEKHNTSRSAIVSGWESFFALKRVKEDSLPLTPWKARFQRKRCVPWSVRCAMTNLLKNKLLSARISEGIKWPNSDSVMYGFCTRINPHAVALNLSDVSICLLKSINTKWLLIWPEGHQLSSMFVDYYIELNNRSINIDTCDECYTTTYEHLMSDSFFNYKHGRYLYIHIYICQT